MSEKPNLANLAREPHPLDPVVMPLVRILGRSSLSWAQRVQIADAIMTCLLHHQSMMDEHQMLSNCNAQQQAKPPHPHTREG